MTIRKGVLLMAYGTPRNLAEVEPYYTDIRGGRPPSPELLAELRERYRAIGGRSPLNEITEAQAQGLAARLGSDYRVYVGMRHWHPYIAETLARMAEDGVAQAVGLALAPQYSAMSVGAYRRVVEEGLARLTEPAPRFHFVDSWHRNAKFVSALARRVGSRLAEFPDPKAVRVIFTAHSLPERVAAAGDPYPEHLRETAALVAGQVGLTDFQVAYQSAGRTPEPWLGPDVKDAMRALARDGVRAVLVCPAGFVADHLEVMYDLDIEVAQLAGEIGIAFARTESLNAAPDFVEALADVVTNAG